LFEWLSTVGFSFIDVTSVNDAIGKFIDVLLNGAITFISQRSISNGSTNHPWLNERCHSALLRKHAAFGSNDYKQACQDCSLVLQQEFQVYVNGIKRRLASLRRGSKQFWNLSKKLLLGVEKVAIPALQSSSSSWVQDPGDKANLFAQTFRDKWVLPQASQNLYSFDGLQSFVARSGFLQLRSRDARFYLSSLDVSSATGPDGLSTMLLRSIADVIAIPFSRLARRIVAAGEWPSSWKVHWITPLHKKGKRTSAHNYRGLQITSQLSKAMERYLGCHFLPQLSYSGSFGQSQFAYRKFHGARDAVLFVLLVWLLAFARGRKVGLYCSDVAGAFDRVSCELLLSKLERSIIHRDLLKVISSWLVGRVGKVIVQGASSVNFLLKNMCFQGTVWGPALWNIFFSDAPLAMRRCAFKEIMYADDLNAYREFDNSV